MIITINDMFLSNLMALVLTFFLLLINSQNSDDKMF